MISNLAKRVVPLAVVLVLGLSVAGAALADHEPINIDGNLTDLSTAVDNNPGATGGGFHATSPIGNVYSGKCRFINGFDATDFYLFVDFKSSGGGVVDPGGVTLYAGWTVVGQIGDVDGDGIPDAFGGLGSDPCALSDGPLGTAVGPLESYRIIGDLNCDNSPDITIVVKSDDIQITLAGGATVPAEDPSNPDMFAIDGSNLELRIGRLDALLPDMDLCNATWVMTANAEQDGLGEDFGFMGQLEIQPSVAVTKTPDKQILAVGTPDQDVQFTITVKNDGLCVLHNVTVDDMLPSDLTFVSSTPDRDSGGNNDATWLFTDLGPGETQVITLNAQVAGLCSQQMQNDVSVSAMHLPPAACALDPREATASASALVNCPVEDPPPCRITGPDSLCVGAPLTLCGPDETGQDYSYRWTAPDLQVFTSDDSCMTFDPAFSGVYTLVVIDNATGLESDPCPHLFKQHKKPLCTIAAPEQACEGERVQICGPQGDFTYMWTLPDGSNASTQCLDLDPVTVANAGTYSLVVTDNRTGCRSDGPGTNPCEVTLVVNQKPACVITASVDNPVPVGSDVELCGPDGDYAYAWVFPSGATATTRCVDIINAQAGDDGTYELTVTDNASGCSSTCSYTLSFDQSTPCSITGPSNANPGETVMLCGPDNADTYLWMLPDGSTQSTQCITIGPITEADEGIYTLTINSGGVDETCSFRLTVNDVCENCPRSADWWSDEWDDKGKGHPAFSPEDLQMIAECVDGLSDFFDWGTGSPVTGGFLIEKNSAWKCYDFGLDLGTAWRETSYDDAGWIVGPGALGYGENYVSTQVSYGPDEDNKYPTTYFRKSFELQDASAINSLMLRATYDDGIVVYLNGVEVARRSLDEGPITYYTQAHSHESNMEYEEIDLAAFMSYLQNGTNVLAVEVHQVDETSSDMVWDAELEATVAAPPVAGDWRFDNSGADLGTSWTAMGYNDAGWSSGSGIFGYGENYVTVPVPWGSDPEDKPITTYFRKVINVTGAAAITDLTLDLMYDDGVCVYINGVEVVRRSIDLGPVYYDTEAHSHEAAQNYEVIDLSNWANLLNDGLNIIAAEVHQVHPGSSDMVFAANLDIQGSVTLLSNTSWAEGLPGGGLFGDDPPGGVVGQLCAVFDAKRDDERSEAKAQFAALLANVCASGKPVMGKKNNGVCLNLDTPVDCKNLTATTVAELIDEVDALLAALEPQPLGDVEDQYEDIIRCLEEINNGWSIPVPKKQCSEDDKKGRQTPSGDHVVVELGTEATITFEQVAIEGITYIVYTEGWVLPQGMMSLDGAGKVMELSTTATTLGDVTVTAYYDETLLQAPESELKLLRFDAGLHQWIDVTQTLDTEANSISGIADGLAPFVIASPWAALSADDPAEQLGFAIRSSYPNPTSGRTTVRFALTKAGPVQLTVHDIQGRQVATLESGHLSAGEHTSAWNGRGADGRKLSAGIYMIRLQANEGLRTGKLVIMN